MGAAQGTTSSSSSSQCVPGRVPGRAKEAPRDAPPPRAAAGPAVAPKPPAAKVPHLMARKGNGFVTSPDTDPYDPTKPEYIVSASTREILEESAKQRRQQIDRLETALSNSEGHRSTKPRVLLRYRQHLRDLQPGRRAKPGVIREARDVPMPHVGGGTGPGSAPPTHSSPAAVLLFPPPGAQQPPAAAPGDGGGETTPPERLPPARASRAPMLTRTSSSPALPFQAADSNASSLDGSSYRTSSSMPLSL